MRPGPPGVRGGNSLQTRFMLLMFAAAALLALVAATVAYQLAQTRALASSRSSAEALATAVEKTVAIGAYAGDLVLMQEVADGLAHDEMVANVEVRAADGRALVQVRNPGAAAAGGTLLTRALVSPFDAKEQLGQLRIRLNDARVHAAADRESYTLATAMVAQAALLALVLYLLAARLVSQPIVHLAAALRGMTPGSSERLATPPNHAGDEIGMLIAGANTLLDANERQLQTERGLRAEVEAMEAQYRQIFDSSSAGIFVLDEGGRLINGNPTVSRVVGLSMRELRGLSQHDFISRVFHRPEEVTQMIEDATAHGETVSADLELVQQGDMRRWVHCLISVQRSDGQTVEGVIYDITERKSDENAARHRAEHDPLTQLKNRAGAQVTLERFVSEALTRQSALCVACIDLDGFKQVNDNHGHGAGDEVLVISAERMRGTVRRSSDLVARLGGDEFLVALRDVGAGDALLGRVMQELVDGLCQPIVLSNGETVTVGVSIGVACLPLHGATPQALLRAADDALYHVKRNGKHAFALALPG